MIHREVSLPSGAVLKVGTAPFVAAKTLYQQLLAHLQAIPFSTKTEMESFFKDAFCVGFSSPAIEAWVWECGKHCLYSADGVDLKLEPSVFDPPKRREDYTKVVAEVVKENVLPFVKSLYAEWKDATTTIERIHASTQKTTTS